MIRGLYTAAAGMLASSIGTDTLANNLANVNTVGFKSNKISYQSFPEMLINRMSAAGSTPVGGVMTGSAVYDSIVNFQPGAMRETSNPLDLALGGDGFFTVKDPQTQQLYYTRAGGFTVNEQGYLTTLAGDYVQGQAGNILMPINEGRIIINNQGDIAVNGANLDRLKVTRFADNNTLAKVGDTKFAATAASQALEGETVEIRQGYLEQSNTNPISELVNNIQGIRLYEALQKNIHLSNETLQKAVNEVGRYR